MANTYSQLYVHIVFAVSGRAMVLPKEHKSALHEYIAGIIRSRDCTPIAINSVSDHMHVLIGLHPKISVSQLVKAIKGASSRFINQSEWLIHHFEWQEGFGAFSVANSDLHKVISYVKNQEQDHAKVGFDARAEMVGFLRAAKIAHDEKFVFESILDSTNIAL